MMYLWSHLASSSPLINKPLSIRRPVRFGVLTTVRYLFQAARVIACAKLSTRAPHSRAIPKTSFCIGTIIVVLG